MGPLRLQLPGAGQLTFAEEGADHEAEGDGGDGKAGQEDQHQRGVAVREHRHVLLHLRGRARWWRGTGTQGPPPCPLGGSLQHQSWDGQEEAPHDSPSRQGGVSGVSLGVPQLSLPTHPPTGVSLGVPWLSLPTPTPQPRTPCFSRQTPFRGCAYLNAEEQSHEGDGDEEEEEEEEEPRGPEQPAAEPHHTHILLGVHGHCCTCSTPPPRAPERFRHAAPALAHTAVPAATWG